MPSFLSHNIGDRFWLWFPKILLLSQLSRSATGSPQRSGPEEGKWFTLMLERPLASLIHDHYIFPPGHSWSKDPKISVHRSALIFIQINFRWKIEGILIWDILSLFGIKHRLLPGQKKNSQKGCKEVYCRLIWAISIKVHFEIWLKKQNDMVTRLLKYEM